MPAPASPSALRVGFVLLSNSASPQPSTRIAVLNMLPFLRDAGIEPVVLFDPAQAGETPDLTEHRDRILHSGCSVVVFQKVHGPSVTRLAGELRERGVRTLYLVCDRVDNELVRETDAAVVVTDYLRELHARELQSRIFVVHDGIERPEVVVDRRVLESGESRPVVALLVTSQTLHRMPVLGFPPPGYVVECVGRYRNDVGSLDRMRQLYRGMVAEGEAGKAAEVLALALHPRFRTIPWDPEGVYDRIRRADVGIIPIDTSQDSRTGAPAPDWKVKSENRLTLLMSAGLPVIATPIPSYESIIDDGVNGFFARSRSDWSRRFEMLRDPLRRSEVGQRARESVVDRFSMRAQADSLIDVLRRVCGVGRTNAVEPCAEH